ncbi:MAG TPA: hypothetical protein PLD27_05565 [bacterium]|nr:hypothetical protein [bacterium]HOL47835.1 hypothetical protein [bacterium]HPQ19548.1 hypothetical protein [bacterium]
MSNETKQIFTIEVYSLKPYSGKIIDNASGETAEFKTTGEQLNFIVKNFKGAKGGFDYSEFSKEKGVVQDQQSIMTQQQPVLSGNLHKDEENLKLVNDVKMPPREKIKEELKKVSNFTDDELEILDWSSTYKAYSLIVRYGQKGVEEEFRNQRWFQKELKRLLKKKEKESGKDKEKKKLEKEQKKEERKRRKEEKKKEREERKREKEERKKEKELRKMQKELEKKEKDEKED